MFDIEQFLYGIDIRALVPWRLSACASAEKQKKKLATSA
jgi:hypothetical protein